MKTFIVLCFLLLGYQATYATHLLGGYIQVKPVTGQALSYEVNVILYFNDGSGKVASDNATSLTVCFGDGQTGTIPRSSRTFFNNNLLSINSYRTVHTYAGPGTFTISTAQLNRTGSLNIPASSTQQEPLTLTTTFLTNAVLNQTPALSIPSTGFQVGINQHVVVPLSATDAENDSLVYGLARPLTSPGNDLCSNRLVSTYQFPNDLAHQGTFKLNSRTGGLTWDVPTQLGYFSVAITVSEYRNGVLISQTNEEIPLIAEDKPGTPGVLPPYEPAQAGALVTALPDYHDEAVALSVFPNPVDDQLQVVLQTRNLTQATIQLLDVNGRILRQSAAKPLARQHEQQISMGNLSSGTYLLRASVDGHSLMQKVIKK